ncbi:MAG: glycosyltransferase [Candidatus Bathyarchaeota archaeon]
MCMLGPFPLIEKIRENRLGNSYGVGLVDGFAEESNDLNLTIFANKYGKEENQKYQNVEINRIWKRGKLNPFILFKEIARLKPDIVHVQYVLGAKYGKGLYTLNPFIFMFFLKVAQFPLLITLHDVIPTQELSGTFKKMFKKFQKISFVYSLGYRFATMFMGKIASRIIILDQGTKKWTIEQYGFSQNKITIIPHGMLKDPEISELRQNEETIKILKDWNYLLFFGKIHPRKGIEYAVKALPYVLEKHPKTKLLIAGNYSGSWQEESKSYLASLKKLAKDLSIENHIHFEIKFLGEEIPIIFEAADVIVLPYVVPFGASGVIKLAATYKKPVIAPYSLSREGEITNGISGYLLARLDEKILAQRINELLENKSLSKTMGQQFYEENRKSSVWTEVAKRTLEVYKII